MTDINIPPSALEAAARKITAVTMGLANAGDRLPDTLWKQYLPEARAALLAGLKAWPGMGPIRTDQPIGDWCDKLPAIILPLTEKPE